MAITPKIIGHNNLHSYLDKPVTLDGLSKNESPRV